MSATAGSYIYTGAWINWSRGAILGATITLFQRDGSLLTAFLSVFVTVAGGACWRILSFLVHQHRAGPDWKHNDTLHRPRQVIFRNSGSSTAAWQLAKLAWDQRTLAKKPILRNLPFLILAVCNTLLFAVAGIFSSEVTKAAGNETLITSPNCGYLQPNFSSSSEPTTSTTKEANDTLAAIAYARACYGDALNELQCGRFAQPKLMSIFKTNASCPFMNNLCLEGPTAAFQVKSGWIDTHKDLGINSKVSDRLQYRKVTTCSVLRSRGYVNEVNSTDSLGNPQRLAYYNFGSTVLGNTTFIYNLNGLQGLQGYVLTSYRSTTESSDAWIPIPELNRTDAHVTIMFLAQNSVTYTAPVQDPWFKATIPIPPAKDDEYNLTTYTSDYYVSVLGCADQFQLCTQAQTKCTPLTTANTLPEAMTTLQMNKVQKNILIILYNAIMSQSTYYNVNSRGASALRASDTLSGSSFVQVGLPNNQWTMEISNWFAVSMAKLQQQVVDFATGPFYTHDDLTLVPGSTESCGRQKIRSAVGYLSFSVLGVSLILAIGGVLILTSLVLDTVVGYCRKAFDWDDYKRLQWAMTEQLALEKLAYPRDSQRDESSAGNVVEEITTLDKKSGPIIITEQQTHRLLE